MAGRDGQGQGWRKPRFLKNFFLLFRVLGFLVFQVSVRFFWVLMSGPVVSCDCKCDTPSKV